MVIYPAGMAVLLIWALASVRDLDRGVAISIALVSFGMLAPFRLPIGGMTPIASHVAAALSIGVLALWALVLIMQRRVAPRIALSGAVLIAFALYSIFASVFLVQFFAGDFLVFSFAREAVGERVSPLYPSMLTPLRRSASNVSQTLYLLISVAFFFAAVSIGLRRGPTYLIFALRMCAVFNLTLGALTVAGLGSFLAVIRTANYALLDFHTLSGVSRIIGGFAEASAFGAHSAMLAAIFLTHGAMVKSPHNLTLGGANAVLAALALSSTAIVGLAALLVFFAAWGLATVLRPLPRRSALLLCSGGALAVLLAIVAGAMLWSDFVWQALDTLILSKSSSTSGLERGAQAANGFYAAWMTYGLGAGVGSVRANGIVSALLAATGIPGTALFIGFVYLSFVSGVPHDLAARRTAQAGAFVSMAVGAMSSYSVDPGLLFMTCAAISIAACRELGGTAKSELVGGRASLRSETYPGRRYVAQSLSEKELREVERPPSA